MKHMMPSGEMMSGMMPGMPKVKGKKARKGKNPKNFMKVSRKKPMLAPEG